MKRFFRLWITSNEVLHRYRKKKEDPFADGMNKIYKQITTALDELGVKPIEAVGKELIRISTMQ